MVFKIWNGCDFVTELCRQQAEVIRNHDTEKFSRYGTKRKTDA